jgi:hypothetical protein
MGQGFARPADGPVEGQTVSISVRGEAISIVISISVR